MTDYEQIKITACIRALKHAVELMDIKGGSAIPSGIVAAVSEELKKLQQAL